MKNILFVLLSTILFFPLAAIPSFSTETNVPGTAFYVSPVGNDAWSGKIADPSANGDDGPFATLERARDEIRSLKHNSKLPDGATVYLRGGIYNIKNTFNLTQEDNGNDLHPFIYAAFKDESPRLVGGVKLDPSWFAPVTDATVLQRFDEKTRPNVLQADLSAHGITDYGTLKPRGFGQPARTAAMELFFDGKPMQLARTPNKAWAKIASVPDGQKGARFATYGDSAKSWASFDDIWVHGYWTYNWADSYVKVKSIDPEKKIVTTEEPYGVYGYSTGRRFRYVNVLETLDTPGEWYVDRKTGILYFWPPSPIAGSEIIVSMLEGPIVSMKDAANVTLRGLTIEITRGSGVEIIGGKDSLIAGCTIRNTGNSGVSINGGERNGITSSDIYETGDGAITLDGGDRKTLAPSGNFAVNNDIHNFSRWSRTYTPGVLIHGVGNRIEHNHIHDAPHVGILLGGNDHLIESNEINDINWETSDVGGFYIGRDWTERGNIVRYNFFHNIHALSGGGPGIDSNSVYLDDCACGTTIFGNVFYKVSRGVFIGGGRDNTVENNIFVDATPAVLVDARCLGWASDTVVPGGTLYNRLMDMNYKQPPYSSHYPELVNILNDQPGAPKGNVITRNVSVKSEFLHLQDVDKNLLIVKDNLVDADPLFIDAAKMNFQLRDDSPAYKLGFRRIPFDKIGLYIDEYRKYPPEKPEKE